MQEILKTLILFIVAVSTYSITSESRLEDINNLSELDESLIDQVGQERGALLNEIYDYLHILFEFDPDKFHNLHLQSDNSNFEKMIEVDYFLEEILDKILKKDQSIINMILHDTLDNLEINHSLRNHFVALCTIITSFQVDISIESIEKSKAHENAFKLVVELLNLQDDGQLELIIDLLTCNPHSILKCKTTLPSGKILPTVKITEIDDARQTLITDILGINRIDLDKLANKWINVYNLKARGYESLLTLAEDVLHIKPIYLKLLLMINDDFSVHNLQLKQKKI